MKTGKQKAYPVEWGSSESKNGKAFVFIDFETEDGTITWRGFLTSDFGVKNASETLVHCGYRDETLDFINSADALVKDKPVSITVIDEEWEGKTYQKVSWVNPIRTTEKKTLKGFSLKEVLAETYAKAGVSMKPRATKPVSTAADCPF